MTKNENCVSWMFFFCVKAMRSNIRKREFLFRQVWKLLKRVSRLCPEQVVPSNKVIHISSIKIVKMVYIGADGTMNEKRSLFRFSIITDIIFGIMSAISLFFKTMTAGPEAIAAVSGGINKSIPKNSK